jgi:hypothetical protein
MKLCLNKTYSKIRRYEHLSDAFPIQKGPEEGDALSPLLFNLALEYPVRKNLEHLEGIELNGTHTFLVYITMSIY